MPSAAQKKAKRKQALKNRREQEDNIFSKEENTDVQNDEPLVMEEAKTEVARKIEAKGLAEAEFHSGVTAHVEQEQEEAKERKAVVEERRRKQEEVEENKFKKRNRLTVPMLAKVVDPSLHGFMELGDENAPDPCFTLAIKACRNSVPVPREFRKKAGFLQSQTTREPGDYVVPDFVRDTGVNEVRGNPSDRMAVHGFHHNVQAKFSFPDPRDVTWSKQPMLKFGEVFYEEKDLTGLRNNYVPGKMSERLRKALGMGENHPPPWLVGMQALGRLPPSYPQMKIPGLNAPIPPSGNWGNAVGQWGEPVRRSDDTLKWPAVTGVYRAQQQENVLQAEKFWGYLRRGVVNGDDEDAEEDNLPPAKPLASSSVATTTATGGAKPPQMSESFLQRALGGAYQPGMAGAPGGVAPSGMPAPPMPANFYAEQTYIRQQGGASAQGVLGASVQLQAAVPPQQYQQYQQRR